MCGICGFYDLLGKNRISQDQLLSMRDMMIHRGPDDAGIYLSSDKRVGLAHRRLSIIDLSKAGHQPMCDDTKRFWISYNGEVYNYRELRFELEAKGYKFTSKTDTEVVLKSYVEWGAKCIEKFNGMWAFAIWDNNKKQLFVARDRFGIKPLYYWYEDSLFLFASEIKAILKSSVVDKILNNTSIIIYLESGLVDGIEDTFFKGIKRLMPAHYMMISENNMQVKEYWSLNEERNEKKRNELEDIKRFRELFKDSVKLRLRSDVPIGTCLSGGLDSSSIVATIAEMSDQNIKTFSSYFDGKEYNESLFFNLVADRYDTDKHIVRPKGDEFIKNLSKIIWFLEEPPRALGVYPQWHVVELAHPHVKVLLDGQGGDEILAGYTPYYEYYLLGRLKDVLKKHSIKGLLNLFREDKLIRNISGENSLKKTLILYLAHLPFLSHFKQTVLRKTSIIDRDFYSNNVPRKPIHKKLFTNELNNKLYWDVMRDSLPALLKYEDKIGMAFSIETRVPFLDYRLVEFIFSLPEQAKINRGWTKYILRKSIDSILPDEITWRKDKKGFPTPIKEWVRKDLKEDVEKILFDGRLANRKILNMKMLNQQFDRHCNGEIDLSWEIWRWVCLELWFRIFIDKEISKNMVSKEL